MVLWFYVGMKTTLDLPDDLYALVKARAALEGRTLRSVMEELLKGWVGSDNSSPIGATPARKGSGRDSRSEGMVEEPETARKQKTSKSEPAYNWSQIKKAIDSAKRSPGGSRVSPSPRDFPRELMDSWAKEDEEDARALGEDRKSPDPDAQS